MLHPFTRGLINQLTHPEINPQFKDLQYSTGGPLDLFIGCVPMVLCVRVLWLFVGLCCNFLTSWDAQG